MNKFLLLLLFSILISCSSDKEKVGKLTDFIPENAALIVRSNSIKTLETDLKNNTFLNNFSKTSLYSYLSDDILHTRYLNPISEVLIAFNMENDSSYLYTFITRQHPKLFLLDSLKDKKIETLTYEDFSIQKVTTDEGILFSNSTDSVFIASSSEAQLKSILTKNSERKGNKGATLEKIYGIGSRNALTIFVNGKKFPDMFSGFFPNATTQIQNFTSWMALDIHVNPDEIKVNGIAIAQDTIPQLLEVFKGTVPQKNEIARVTPTSASGFVSYTYNDYEVLSKNLEIFQKSSDTLPKNIALFQSLNEIGVSFKENEKIVALHAIDGSITEEFLYALESDHTEFRDISIKTLSDSGIFNRAFHPLITGTKPKYFAQLEDFFVFTENENTLQDIITDYLNGTALANQPFYEAHTAEISSESSILFVALHNNLKNDVAGMASSKNATSIKDLKFNKNPMSAIQFVYDTNFAHINGILKETQSSQASTGVSQAFAITLENTLLTNPQLVTNHLTKGKDIVVQDVTNKLYLISSGGRVLWNKQLDGPVLGKIEQVDVLKNGRLQLAFATNKTFYILDRDGAEVAPFPLKFKDAVTQPLAVFDYDNNRDYRFIITQERDIFMYDSKGKSMSGFTFKKAGSKVILPPKHLRIAAKDYIVIAEENGKLNLLHRTGASRINVNTKFKFGESEVYQEDGNFVFITSENAKVTINKDGKVSTQNLNASAKLVWEIVGKNKVTLEDNILRINNNRVELPFGLYTKPKISISNQRVLISITDLQQQRTYVYNSLGELLPNFPVYGTSAMDMGDATNNGKPNGVVKGEDNGVVLYELN
ncbi:MAG: hypothetical protein H0X63_02225 [Flavobacteriales bacterium]|nr:hypothetical protein [Flavobacteriales bacterium]